MVSNWKCMLNSDILYSCITTAKGSDLVNVIAFMVKKTQVIKAMFLCSFNLSFMQDISVFLYYVQDTLPVHLVHAPSF